MVVAAATTPTCKSHIGLVLRHHNSQLPLPTGLRTAGTAGVEAAGRLLDWLDKEEIVAGMAALAKKVPHPLSLNLKSPPIAPYNPD
jgi:hypothetical protein